MLCWADSAGSLVCVVGRVGTGKSTLLNGLIGEVRKTRGSWTLGGSVAYGEFSISHMRSRRH